MYGLCTRLFAFSPVDLSRSPSVFPYANYTRTADQNVTPPTSTQHSTGKLALHKQLLALSIRCSHQIMDLFFLTLLHVLVAFFLARAKRAASAARGAEPLKFNTIGIRRAFIPAFSEPQSHWPSDPPPLSSVNQRSRRARRELPFGAIPTVPPHPGRIRPHPRFRHPSISRQLRHTEDENREFSRIDTAPHGKETSIPRVGC